jgi:hypothetical protein
MINQYRRDVPFTGRRGAEALEAADLRLARIVERKAAKLNFWVNIGVGAVTTVMQGAQALQLAAWAGRGLVPTSMALSAGGGTTVRELTAATPTADASLGRLVHLTSGEAGASINASQTLLGRNGIYATPLSTAQASGLRVTALTGLRPSQYAAAVPIPSGAQGAFTRPLAIGPISMWQRATGQVYTAAGSLNLATGVFTRTGVNWNQALIYGADAAITAGIAGGTGLVLHSQWTSKQPAIAQSGGGP